MKRFVTRLLPAAAALLIAVSLLTPAFAADAADRVLTVAFPESKGLNEVYEDGTYGGCTYDWLMEIAKFTGWKYEFVTGDVSQLVDGMLAGEYDLMGGMYYSEETTQNISFPRYIMGSNYSLLIYRRDDKRIRGYDINTMNGMRIGVLRKATEKISRLEKYLDAHSLSCELVYFDDEESYMSCLDNGQADLLLGSDIYLKDSYNVAARFDDQPFYLVTRADDPVLCALLDEAMTNIYACNPNFAQELYDKYYPSQYINAIMFSAAESAWLKSAEPVRVAVLDNQYPVYYDDGGAPRGILVDCLEEISDRTGLRFQYVHAQTFEKAVELVKSGRAEVVGGYLNGDRAARAGGLVRTKSYGALNTIIVRNSRAAIGSDHLIMAVPGGLDTGPLNPGDSTALYPTYEECLQAVNRGEADYMQVPSAVLDDLNSRDYYGKVVTVLGGNLQMELSFALPEPVDVTLYSILSKAVNNFSEKELEALLDANTLLGREKAVNLKTVLYTNPLMVVTVCSGFILLLAAAALLTVRYRMNARLMRLKLEKAEETGKAKLDFLSRMSHEIRTPMNAILGLTALARRSGDLTAPVEENLRKINDSAKFLLSLLNDILDMSKIDSQRMKIEISPFDMREVVSQVEGMFSLQAEDKGLKLIVDCRLETPYFLGDEIRIKQVLTNLLSNAYKFTDCGSITLSVLQEETRDGAAVVSFHVKDTGIGIREADQARIFFSFEQAANSNRTSPGSGLGLAISSSLVQLMGGELKLESTYGAGSDFFFSLALAQAQGAAVPPREAPASTQAPAEGFLAGKRVLLAEDNEINAEIASELLALKEICVDWAKDGQDAVDRFQAQPEGYYDVILMDINMPVKDGLTASAEIRALNRGDAGRVPILAMTANTFQEDRDAAQRAGMSGFLPKPFDVEKLYEILGEVLSGQEPE